MSVDLKRKRIRYLKNGSPNIFFNKKGDSVIHKPYFFILSMLSGSWFEGRERGKKSHSLSVMTKLSERRRKRKGIAKLRNSRRDFFAALPQKEFLIIVRALHRKTEQKISDEMLVGKVLEGS